MSKRKIQSRRRRRLEFKQRLTVIALVLLLGLGVFFGVRVYALQHTLHTQNAMPAWVRDDTYRYAQTSVFLPNDTPAAENDVFSFRQALAERLKTDSMQAAEGGSLFVDAYSGKQTISVSTRRMNMDVKTIGVGGEYFLFHPMKLLSGGYLSERDFANDRVVLDDTLAWALFGTTDVIGQSILIGTREYPVVGVVQREDDFASKAAYTDGPGMFMSFSAMNEVQPSGVNAYEIILPDPVKGYAASVVKELFSPNTGSIVENSSRFSILPLFRVLGDFGRRSMNETGILYPYWENAARMVEDHAALALLLCVVFLVFPTALGVYNAVRWSRRAVEEATDYVAEEIEKMVEEEKEKNYVRQGI